MRQADSSIRGAYVNQGPMEFRIVVGHRDIHRAPAAIRIEVRDVVRLTAQLTELWIRIRIIVLPKLGGNYYSAVIVEQLVAGSRYQASNRVRSIEDQFAVEAPRAALRMERRRN